MPIETRRQRYQTHRFSPEIQQDLKSLTTPSSLRGVLAVLEDWGLIAMGSSAILLGFANLDRWWGAFAFLFGLVVNGARMRALATLLHESAHNSLSRLTWLNSLLGTVGSAWWVLQVRGRYIRSHVQDHHTHLGDPELDPDTAQYVRQGLLRASPNTLFLSNFIMLLLGGKTLVNLPYLLRDRLLPKPGAKLSAGEWTEIFGFLAAWSFLIAFLAAKGWLLAFFLVWVLPYLTTFQAINWVIETSEHFPLIWTRSDPFQITRNRKGPALEQFLFGCHGEGWHRVHHERPAIPFWNMRQAHAAMMRDPDYAAFERESGGLFVRGPQGEPSILSTIQDDLAALNAAAQVEVRA